MNPLVVDGLQYVIDGVHIEGIRRKSLVRGKKYHRRRIVAQLVEKRKAIATWHLNVE